MLVFNSSENERAEMGRSTCELFQSAFPDSLDFKQKKAALRKGTKANNSDNPVSSFLFQLLFSPYKPVFPNFFESFDPL